MREETLVLPAHPEYINGAQVWTQGGTVGEIVHRIQHGDPTKGWEGDPRIVVLYHKDADQWILARLEADNKYRVFAANAPGAPLGLDVIDKLIAHDSRRGYHAKTAIDAHNAKVQKDKDELLSEKMAERYRRLAFEAKKTGLID